MVSGTEATISSEPLKSTASESDLSDILALPKPKEKSGRKRKPSINQKTVCVTDDAVFDRFFLLTNSFSFMFFQFFILLFLLFSFKKSREGEIKKGKRTKKKQKAKSKKAKQPVEDLETMLEKLTLDDGTAGDDATEDEAICPNCGKLYSSDTENEL